MEERFDYRRFFIINAKRIWIVLAVAVAMTAVFGGGYYLKNYIFDGPDIYRSDAMYQIDFDTEKYDETIAYYNDYTWNDVIDSDLIAGVAADNIGISKSDIVNATTVPTMSDISLFHVYVDTTEGDTSEKIQGAICDALKHFSDNKDGFISITKWDQKDVYIYHRHMHLLRVLVVGFILGLIVGIIVLCYVNIMDSSIYVAGDMVIKGIEASYMVVDNDYEKAAALLDIKLKDKDTVTVIATSVMDEINIENKSLFGERTVITISKNDRDNIQDYYNKIKDANALVMIVKAGNKDGAIISEEIQAIKSIGKNIDAAVIVGQSGNFMKKYYG